MARNPGTRIGRPPMIKSPPKLKLASGEKQSAGPTDTFDSAVPGAAYRQGMGRMPKHHDDPTYCRGGPTKRR